MSVYAANPIYPSNILTVVIRDDSPLVHCNDSPSYRSVRIELSQDQVAKLALYHTHQCGTAVYHESISKCFIEPKGGAL